MQLSPPVVLRTLRFQQVASLAVPNYGAVGGFVSWVFVPPFLMPSCGTGTFTYGF